MNHTMNQTIDKGVNKIRTGLFNFPLITVVHNVHQNLCEKIYVERELQQ